MKYFNFKIIKHMCLIIKYNVPIMVAWLQSDQNWDVWTLEMTAYYEVAVTTMTYEMLIFIQNCHDVQMMLIAKITIDAVWGGI